MKLLIISDIHGSSFYGKKIEEIYKKEQPDKIVLLGDLYYHGPRNDLTQEYNPMEVAKILNSLKDKLLVVKGNCDAEVDQMVLDFPMMADYATIDVDGHHFFLSHGHLFNEENLPNLNEGDIFVYGHIHRPVAKCENGIYIINPSSISLPKEGRNSYGIYEDDKFIIKEFDNTIVKEIIIK